MDKNKIDMVKKETLRRKRAQRIADVLTAIFFLAVIATIGGSLWFIWSADIALPLQVMVTAFITALVSDQIGREFFG